MREGILEWLEIGLTVAGVSLLLLVAMSFVVPKALEWKKGLADLRPLLRQMFWTYAAYVTLVHLFFGLMSLCCGDWLINGGRPAFLVLCLMLIWWCVRIWIHFFCFDRSGIPKNRFNHYAEAILVTLFLGLVFVYGTALYFHVERIYG